MGGGGSGRFSGTQGGRRILSANTKVGAMQQIPNLPKAIQDTAKRFFRGGSNKYDSFNAEQLGNGNTLLKMEKPGNVPGSRAVYYKEVDVHGKTVRVYKTTYGPDGRIIHIKEK